MLSLQHLHAASPETADAPADAIARVNAVGEAHLALQMSDDLQAIEFLGKVTCACGSPVMLETDRPIPLALIVSELITKRLAPRL